MRRLILVTWFSTVFCGSVIAEVPRLLNYQGMLTDSTGTLVPDGSCSVDIADLTYLVAYMFKNGPPPKVECP